MNRLSFTARWILVWAVFVLCIASTFISYRPYAFHWDDAEYLWQSIGVSKAFWGAACMGLPASTRSSQQCMGFVLLP